MKKYMKKWLSLVCVTGAGLVVSGIGFAEDKGLNNITADTFSCIRDMTKVNHFYVDNLLGDLDGTVAIAKSEDLSLIHI